eukprot:6549341-Heterocapsa_arctica.AAC.1
MGRLEVEVREDLEHDGLEVELLAGRRAGSTARRARASCLRRSASRLVLPGYAQYPAPSAAATSVRNAAPSVAAPSVRQA